MTATAPSLTIITICRNDRPGLERTLASIRAQTWRDFDVEVVDGASTDGTADFVRALAEPWLRATSEPDGGIYDAQNKGWRRARGEFCLFLNAGDALAGPDVLARVFAAPIDADVAYCDILRVWPTHSRVHRVPERVTLAYLLKGMLPHQSTFLRRDLLERVGPYDTGLKIVADYDLLFRALVVRGLRARRVPVALSVFEMGGVSSRPELRDRKLAERALVQRRHLPALVVEHLAEQDALRERGLARRVRALLRPIARVLRTASRRLRGLPAEF